MEEERVIHAVRTAIWQGLEEAIDDIADMQGIPDAILDAVCEALDQRRATIFCCDRYGHYMANDHCGKPEHRYCLFCAAPPSEKAETGGGHGES